ncbi:MAG: nitroreductase family protein [Mariniblastus sp.]|nr:nitroreductase family protein [Mariniblastus sp.]
MRPDDDSPPISEPYRVVADVMEQRQTWKVLADPKQPLDLPGDLTDRCNSIVRDAVRHSGWAPFHYARKHQGLVEPWRFHVVHADACRKLAVRIPEWFTDVKPTNKLPAMLAACGALVLVNWLPQFDEQQAKEKQVLVNEEHLAAASAAVQNLLLLLTAAGLGTYWSSGGFFRDPLMASKLGIDPAEKLLAAVFVDYLPGRADPSIERIPGKHRDARSPRTEWMREIENLD